MIHQHRAAYELFGTPYSDFEHTEADAACGSDSLELDARMFARMRARRHQCAEHRQPAGAVQRRRGAGVVSSAAACRPASQRPLRRLRAGRRATRAVKRVDLAIRAIAAVTRAVRLVIVGDGSQRAALERDRASMPASPIASRSRARAAAMQWPSCTPTRSRVVYAPFDEDYGYVTLEAFLAAKPVITATDSGGTRSSSCVDGVNGFVCEPSQTRLPRQSSTARRRPSSWRRVSAAPDAPGRSGNVGRRHRAAPWLTRLASRS